MGFSDGQHGADAIAEAFVQARRGMRDLPDYPGTMPRTLDEAYAIQARAIELFGGRIAGWKVGRIAPDLVDRLGSDRLTGPIFDGMVVHAEDGSTPSMPVFARGFAAAEAEYLLRLGTLPDSFARDWTNQAVAAHVDAVHVGIELAGSPYPGINAHGPAVTISDFGNNSGLVVGARLAPASDFIDWSVAMTIDGTTVGQSTAAQMLDGPFGAVRFLFELAAERVLPLASGQWISSGAITGVHPVSPGAHVQARFGDQYAVGCTIQG